MYTQSTILSIVVTSVRLATKQQERIIIDLLLYNLYCLISGVVYMLTKLSIVGSTVWAPLVLLNALLGNPFTL